MAAAAAAALGEEEEGRGQGRGQVIMAKKFLGTPTCARYIDAVQMGPDSEPSRTTFNLRKN